MLWLLRYLLGYILIEISGTDYEQIINRAMANKISIWNLQYKNERIFGNIAAKNFYRLFSIRHGINCKIKIVKKYGLFFRINSYKKRLGIYVGVLIFLTVLFILNNFIWVINIEGNNTISSQEIIKTCNEIGIREGVFKSRIKNKYDSQKLQLAQDKIAWCSFNVEGCVLTINISETKPSDKDKKQIPSNLKSKIAGEIKKINVTSGNVLVKVGDFISEGDLLVSGIIQNNAGTHLVYSEGVIIAKTERVFSAEGKFTQNVLRHTDAIMTHHTIDFFGAKIPFYLNNIKGYYEYTTVVKNLKLFNKKIPIKISTEKYQIINNETVTYSTETLQKILYANIQEQITKFNFITINEKSNEIIETNTGLLLKITYICEENIAIQDKILLSKVN